MSCTKNKSVSLPVRKERYKKLSNCLQNPKDTLHVDGLLVSEDCVYVCVCVYVSGVCVCVCLTLLEK